jgi:phospholipase C
VDRRDFLRTGILLGGAAALGAACTVPPPPPPSRRHTSILRGAPAESGIDTVVIVMMENRSFDSYLGYLAENQNYMERGARLYGHRFHVDGKPHQAFPDVNGTLVETYRRPRAPEPGDPWRGCGLNDPGHGWDAGRAERDHGFLAAGSGNDKLALSYFLGQDLPVYRNLARRFTICDHNHASLLGPTFPNREYLISAQSGGNKTNALPTGSGFAWTTIVDRLVAAGVTVADYASDLPPLALWGPRMASYVKSTANYYDDAAAGKLPQVTYVDPSFIGDNRTDDHPLGDPRAAQQFVRDVFAAFARSPQWERGLFILTYDEWGGFFDHVPPPILPDDRASAVDEENFAQAGFRVPLILCSPHALPNYVDHRTYDHTSIIRFLEWRFLGAPPEGPNARGKSPWWLTLRDRYAANIGRSLSANVFDPDPGFDLDVVVGTPSPPCGGPGGLLQPNPADAASNDTTDAPFAAAYESGYFERVKVPTFVK